MSNYYTAVKTIQDTDDAIIELGIDKSEVDKYKPDTKYADVIYSASAYYNGTSLESWTPATKYGSIIYKVSTTTTSTTSSGLRLSSVATAYASGSDGSGATGRALGGELGPELVVRGTKWFMVGEDGPEFFSYRHGDIVFDAEQTKELLSTGSVSSRGIALAHGTAHGDAYVSGSGSLIVSGGVSVSSSSSGSSSSSSSSSSTSSSSSSDADEFLEELDWIEILLDRIERGIQSLERIADSTYKTYSKRSSALTDQIAAVSQ